MVQKSWLGHYLMSSTTERTEPSLPQPSTGGRLEALLLDCATGHLSYTGPQNCRDMSGPF